MVIVKMPDPNTTGRKSRPVVSRVSRVVVPCYNAIVSGITSFPIKGALSMVRLVVRTLQSLDAKIHQRPASRDLLILQCMLDVAETLPRFRAIKGRQTEVQRHPKRVRPFLVQVVSVPVEWMLRLASEVLLSLYFLDKKLHQRTPRILPILKSALNSTENTLRLVGELEPINQPH